MTPLIVCNIGWMRRYQGLKNKPDDITGGGAYVTQNKRGHEVCNFLRCKDGKTYGHVETIKGKTDREIKLQNLDPKAIGTSLNKIDVVWIATNPKVGGRTVVGWYRNATLYRNRRSFGGRPPSEQHSADDLMDYRISAKNEDVTLVPFEYRGRPEFSLGRGEGWIGQANWWFPERQTSDEVQEFLRNLRAAMGQVGERRPAPSRRWGGNSDVERKAKVEQAALRIVTKYYEDDFDVVNVDKENLGWDLEARPKIGGDPICLEVKGLFDTELKVGLTPREFRALDSHSKGTKPLYRLCVVTGALSSLPKLHVLSYDDTSKEWLSETIEKVVDLKIMPLIGAVISLA